MLRTPAPISPGRGLSLAREPVALARLANGTTDVSEAARAVLAKLDWPDRPAPIVAAPPLTPAERDRFNAGAGIYQDACAGCHRDDGRGNGTLGADLVDSAFVNAADPTAAVRIVLGGKEGAVGMMPPLGNALGDNQVAAVVTYIRRAWGHTGSAVTPLEVGEVRALSRARTMPWTDPELQPAGRGGRGRGAQ